MWLRGESRASSSQAALGDSQIPRFWIGWDLLALVLQRDP